MSKKEQQKEQESRSYTVRFANGNETDVPEKPSVGQKCVIDDISYDVAAQDETGVYCLRGLPE